MISLYLKPTEACNLRCKHCFNSELSSLTSLMPVETALDIIDSFYKEDNLYIIFHGGEPSLAGSKFYEKIVSEFPDLRYSMQTNGIKILKNPEPWKKLKEKISFSLSWDYKIRLFPDGREITSFLLDNLEASREIFTPLSLVVTVTKLLIDEKEKAVSELLKFKPDSLVFERYQPTGKKDDPLMPTHRELSEFFIWLDQQNLPIKSISPITPLKEQLRKGVKRGVSMWSGSCSKSNFTIGPDLKIYSCPNQAGLDLFKPFSIFKRDSLKDAFYSKERLDWIKFQFTYDEECLECSMSPLCNSFCPLVRKLKPFKEDAECVGLKKFLSYMESSYLS